MTQTGTQVSGKPLVSFLIFACPKSGTTWLQRLLCAHPEVHCSESRAFGDFFNPANPSQPHLSLEKYVSFLRWYHHGPVEAADGRDGSALYTQMLHEIVNTIARVTLEAAGDGVTVYGEKATPPSVPGVCRSMLEGWRRYNPALCFVHLVRDPRDVAVSGLVQQYRDRMKRAERIGDAEAAAGFGTVLERREMPVEELERWMSLWQESVREADRACSDLFPGRSVTIRYEDLLERPTVCLEQVLRLIGVAHDTGTTAACVDACTFEVLSGGRRRGCEDRGSFFRKGVAGDWHNWLTDAQADLCLQEAGELMARYGYGVASCDCGSSTI